MTSLSNVFRYPSDKQLTERPIQVGAFRDTSAETSTELTYEEQRKQKQNTAETIVEQAKEQAEQFVVQAKQEAERLHEEAKVSIQQAHQEAKETGYKEGKQEGLVQAKEEYQSLIEQAERCRSPSESRLSKKTI